MVLQQLPNCSTFAQTNKTTVDTWENCPIPYSDSFFVKKNVLPCRSANWKGGRLIKTNVKSWQKYYIFYY